jgi:hypothetical protein
MRKLVMIHGRAQEDKDSVALKQEWISSLEKGLDHHGLNLPIPESDIRFPYYGQTLFDLHKGKKVSEAAEIVVRGQNTTQAEEQFLRSVLKEVLVKQVEAKLAESADPDSVAVNAVSGADVVERGFLNWGWVQKGLEWLDGSSETVSSAAIAVATKDVYEYLNNRALEMVILEGVKQAMVLGEETVVVSHSLGTVVAYSMLHQEGVKNGWKVPLFVTLGSPLGVTAIREHLRPIGHPEVVGKWFNAMDERDVVALYPLDRSRFAITPAIENHTEVDNDTANRHGISGYLSDPVVALQIYRALDD